MARLENQQKIGRDERRERRVRAGETGMRLTERYSKLMSIVITLSVCLSISGTIYVRTTTRFSVHVASGHRGIGPPLAAFEGLCTSGFASGVVFARNMARNKQCENDVYLVTSLDREQSLVSTRSKSQQPPCDMCDPIWHMSSRSGVGCLQTAILLTFLPL